MKSLEEILSKYKLKYCAIRDGDWSHILLAYPYKPFICLGNGYGIIDAYYLASNTLYNLAKQVTEDIVSSGYIVQDFHLSLKPLGEAGGLGKILNNRLLTNAEYGSKMTLQAISVNTDFHLILDELPENICSECGQCDRACPVGALTRGNFCRDKCLRNIQDYPDMHSSYMGNRIIGCEECQKVCPHNSKIAPIDMPERLKQLLRVESLTEMARGGKSGYNELAKYIGSNYARGKYIKRILFWQ